MQPEGKLFHYQRESADLDYTVNFDVTEGKYQHWYQQIISFTALISTSCMANILRLNEKAETAKRRLPEARDSMQAAPLLRIHLFVCQEDVVRQGLVRR